MQSTKGHPPYTQEFIEAEAEALERWMQQSGSIYLKRFSFDRGYSHQRLPEFAEVNDRFSLTFARAREWQEMRLAEGGLMGEFNEDFCKFVMANACGWSDKTQITLSGNADNPLAFILKNIDGKSREIVDETDG